MMSQRILYAAFIVFFGYFIIQTLYYLFLALAGLFQSRSRTFQSKEEDFSIISSSHFTLPVSIILPAHNEERWIADSLKSILSLDYPSFEVIVVNDGSTDRTLEILDSMLSLEAVDKAYKDQFQGGKIHEVYKTRNYPNVTVISKTGGFKKAGAVNAGLNFVRYKYACVVDADTILEPDALLKVMAQVEKDPDKIIGCGSYFGLVNGFKIKDGKILEMNFSFNPLIAYQNLEYIRSFMSSRLVWSAFNAMPNVAGGFGVWRRDVVMRLHGYETGFSSEDIELTFHAHDYMVKNKQEYQILMLPYYVGWTEGPSTIPSLILQRNRWQRVVNETMWRYKHMLFNHKYKWLGFFTFPYYLLYETFGVFIELASIGILTWAWLIRLLDTRIYLTYLLFMLLVQAFISLFVLFAFIRDQGIIRLRYICYFIILSFLELFLYKWIIITAKTLGMVDYARGIRAYEQYQRK
jgi:biofilm PGA synthesis N-glycosyltransferase PgaC